MVDIISLGDDLTQGGVSWSVHKDSEFSSEPFFPDDPEQLMSTGQFNTEVEVIIGTGMSFSFVQHIKVTYLN